VRAIAGGNERGPIISAAVVVSSLLVLGLTVFAGLAVYEVSAIVLILVVAAVAYKALLTWRMQLAVLIAVILFIPIKRYTLPGNLPFDLEFYRLTAAIVLVGWLTSLLIDPRVHFRRTIADRPVQLIVLAALGSDLVNGGHISGLGVQSDVLKAITFLASYFLIFYLISSVVRTQETVDFLVKLLVAGGAVVAFFALVEARTHLNVFDHLASMIPLLRQNDVAEVISRGGDVRAMASSQGPIPLGAMLVMLIPLAVYMARRQRNRTWWACAGLLLIGAMATVSRTSVIMLLVVGIVFLRLRPKETKRLWPALVPAVVLLHVAVPGTIGSLQGAFFPEGGLIAEQSQHPGWSGSGRIADFPMAMKQFRDQPLLGQGFGTRQPYKEGIQAQILDDQWLKTLLETGVIGMLGWLWLYGRFIRRLGRVARRDHSDEGWLLAAITASVTAFAVGMAFFDAFSFVQVTFVLFILFGLGAVVHRNIAPDTAKSIA
jgi:hypothetical protein